MKQVFFDGKGKLLIKEVPAPAPPPNGALVRVCASLISSGTEMTAASGGGSLIRKAIEQPQLIKRAVQLALREGLSFTVGQVQDISESWLPVGYSAAGVVVTPGIDSGGLRAGDPVACAGAGFANHAEYDAVPLNLLVRIPEGITYRQAAFTTLGAIALQGVRRAEVTLGETVVVVGLGLIGQITAQLLDAAGCRVIGSDPVADRRELAAKLAGVDAIDPSLGDAPQQVLALTEGIGADKVILCAATSSSDPTNEAFQMCRERGRVVMVGAMGMHLERSEFYNRELDFVISRSAGPGRYDRDYEERGLDYPIGFVRWTEQRNMEAFLRLLAEGKLDVEALIAAEYPIEEAEDAYDAVQRGALGVLLTYGPLPDEVVAPPRRFVLRSTRPKRGRIGVALVGAGQFARAVHLPNLKASPYFDVRAVVSGGTSAAQVAQKINAPLATTDLAAALADPDVDAVLISTRHGLHAEQAMAAAQAGKHIFVEKPMALTVADCEAVLDSVEEAGVLLTVGFNRRMAPSARALKEALTQLGEAKKTMIFRVNAGPLAASHWLNDPREGGGRLLGEGVHFIDFICGMLDAEPWTIQAQGSADGQSFVITMRFADDSLGVVIYSAQGDPAFPKERIEVFAGGGVAVLDDFRTLRFTGMRGQSIRGQQDKGHRALVDHFGAAIRGEAELVVTGADGLRATRIAQAALESMKIEPLADVPE